MNYKVRNERLGCVFYPFCIQAGQKIQDQVRPTPFETTLCQANSSRRTQKNSKIVVQITFSTYIRRLTARLYMDSTKFPEIQRVLEAWLSVEETRPKSTPVKRGTVTQRGVPTGSTNEALKGHKPPERGDLMEKNPQG